MSIEIIATGPEKYHHIFGINLVDLFHVRCPFGVQRVATFCEHRLPISLRLFVKVSLSALSRRRCRESNYFGMTDQVVYKRVNEFWVYVFSHFKTPDQIEGLFEVQRESKIVLPNEVRPLAASNCDSRSLNP